MAEGEEHRVESASCARAAVEVSVIRHFTVPGRPIPWKRARSNGKRRFTDPVQAEHMERVRAAVRETWYGPPLAVPFRLTCQFFRPMVPWNARFGDRDNLEKLIKDALEGIVWTNDCFVILTGAGGKMYGETERTELAIEQLDMKTYAGAPDWEPVKVRSRKKRGPQPSVRRYGT
jgi:Holliday junction resolvase RusA-like endonuclease